MQTATAKTMTLEPRGNMIDMVSSIMPVKNVQKRTSRPKRLNIGQVTGFYALFFAIVGQVDRDRAGNIREDVIRFPKTADTAIAVYGGREQLDDKNSEKFLIREKNGELQFERIGEETDTMKPRKAAGRKTYGIQLDLGF